MAKKSVVVLITILVLSTVLVGCGAGTGGGIGSSADIQALHDVVSESATLLSSVSSDIYSNWYDAIYKDKFYGNIDIAIAKAQLDNEENINTIKANDSIIKETYKKGKVKNNENAKAVIQAYSDYYEFVINVSGSFNSFSRDNETKKKALSSALRSLEFDI